MDNRLLEILVCPVCRGPLQLVRDDQHRPLELTCAADRLGFPIRDDLPCMLESEARSLDGPTSLGSPPSPTASSTPSA